MPPVDYLRFIRQQATAVMPGIYMKRYEPIVYPDFVPREGDGLPEWTPQVEFQAGDYVGRNAEWFSNGATDIPRVDVTQERFYLPVYEAWLSYGYTIPEMEMAALTSTPLDTRRIDAVRRVSERTIQEKVFLGDADLGWKGFLNSDQATKSDAGGAGNARYWANKSYDLIIKDVQRCHRWHLAGYQRQRSPGYHALYPPRRCSVDRPHHAQYHHHSVVLHQGAKLPDSDHGAAPANSDHLRAGGCGRG